MKAWVLNKIGEIEYKEVDFVEKEEDEVLVKVKAAGICGSDIPRIYQNGAHKMPLILGHEFSGVVEDKSNDKWNGKRVGVFPLIPCKKCLPCQNKQYEMCQDYSYLGSRRDGGFAEYVSVPAWNLIELPENVSYEEAAMLEPMAVATHAMRKLDIKKGNNVLVYGAGTIGLLLTMLLLEKNEANIFVICNKEFQRKTLLEIGISQKNILINSMSDTEDSGRRTSFIKKWLLSNTNNKGIDVAFECVGKNSTYSDLIDILNPSGKLCLVGNPFSNMKLSQEVYWKILRNQLVLNGTWNSSFYGEQDASCSEDDWHYVLNLLKEKKINPGRLITHRLNVENLGMGFTLMHDKSEDYIKVMMV